jgi:hypothetical protein
MAWHFGRPPGDFDFHRQYKRKPARCQRITVSGLTIAKALSMFGTLGGMAAMWFTSAIGRTGVLPQAEE